LVPFPGQGQDANEPSFNRLQKSIRSHGERGNGILKNRWIFLGKDRVLHYSPSFCGKIHEIYTNI